jgi:tRNA pseudouridine38-40 synthase
MIDIDVAEPVEHNGMEWLSVKIHGQSFMLHQIVSLVLPMCHACLTVLFQRKMISMAVLAARTKTPASLIPKTFGKLCPQSCVSSADRLQGPEQIHVPKAPALGLLLEQPRFKTYNDNMLLKAKQNKVEHNHPVGQPNIPSLPLLTAASARVRDTQG